jgi:hypothetical protein
MAKHTCCCCWKLRKSTTFHSAQIQIAEEDRKLIALGDSTVAVENPSPPTDVKLKIV